MQTITSNKELFTSLRNMDLDVRIGENVFPLRKEIKNGKIMLAITHDIDKGVRLEDIHGKAIAPDDIRVVQFDIEDSSESRELEANIYGLSIEKFLYLQTIKWLSDDNETIEKSVVREDLPNDAQIYKFDQFQQAFELSFDIRPEDLEDLDVRSLFVQMNGTKPTPDIYSCEINSSEDPSITLLIAPHNINTKMDVYLYNTEGVLLGSQTVLVSRPINLYSVTDSPTTAIDVDKILRGDAQYHLEYEVTLEFTEHMADDMTVTSPLKDKLNCRMVGYNIKGESVKFILSIHKGTDLTDFRGKEVPLSLVINDQIIKDVLTLQFQ